MVLRFLMAGCVCVFALEMQHEARKRAAEVAGGEEASCTIAVLGNSYEGRGGEVRYGHQRATRICHLGDSTVVRVDGYLTLAIATLFITCLSASGGQGSVQKGSRASSHAGDVTCSRASESSILPASPQLLLLHVCIKTSAVRACSGSLSARVSVSRRNCCADWQEARRYAAVAYVTQKNILLVHAGAVYVYISYLPA
jgi:hypothetical protein